MSSGGFPLGNPTSYTSTRTWNSGPNSINVNQTEIPRTSAPRSNLNNGSNQHPQANDYVNQTVHCARFYDQSEMNLYYHLVFSYNSKTLIQSKEAKGESMFRGSKRSYQEMTSVGPSGALNYLPGQGEQVVCANVMKLNNLLAKTDWDKVQEPNKLMMKFLEHFMAIDFMGVCITPESVTRKRNKQGPDVRTFKIAGEAPTYDIFDPHGPFDPAPSDVIYVLMVKMQIEPGREKAKFMVRSETGQALASVGDRVVNEGVAETVTIGQAGNYYAHLMFYVDKCMQGPPPVFIGRDNKMREVCGYWKIGRIREMSEQGQMNFPEAHLTFTSLDGVDYERDALRTKMVKQCKIYLNPLKGKFNWMKERDLLAWKVFLDSSLVVTRNGTVGATYLLPEVQAMLKGKSDEAKGLPNSYLAQVKTEDTKAKNEQAPPRESRAATLDEKDTTLENGAPDSPGPTPPPLPPRSQSVAMDVDSSIVTPGSFSIDDNTNAAAPVKKVDFKDVDTLIPGRPAERPSFLSSIAKGFMNLPRATATALRLNSGTDEPVVNEIESIPRKPSLLTEIQSVSLKPVSINEIESVPGKTDSVVKPPEEKPDVMGAIMRKSAELAAMRENVVKMGKLGYETEVEQSDNEFNLVESGTSEVKEKTMKKVGPLPTGSVSSKFLELDKFPMSDLQKQNWYLFYVTRDYQARMTSLEKFESFKMPDKKNTISKMNEFNTAILEIASYASGIESYFETNPNEPSLEIQKGGVAYDFLTEIKSEKGSESWKNARDDLIAMVMKISEKYGDFKEKADKEFVNDILTELKRTYYKLLIWETVKHISYECIKYMNAEFPETYENEGVESEKMQQLFKGVALFLSGNNNVMRMLITHQIKNSSQSKAEADIVLEKMMSDYDMSVQAYFDQYIKDKNQDGKNLERERFLLYRNLLLDLMIKGSVSNARFEFLASNAQLERTSRMGAGENLTIVDKKRLGAGVPVENIAPETRKKILQTAEKVDAAVIKGESRFKIRKTGE